MFLKIKIDFGLVCHSRTSIFKSYTTFCAKSRFYGCYNTCLLVMNVCSAIYGYNCSSFSGNLAKIYKPTTFSDLKCVLFYVWHNKEKNKYYSMYTKKLN